MILSSIRELGERLGTVLDIRKGSQVVVVTDRNVVSTWSGAAIESLVGAGFRSGEFVIEPGEGSKSLDAAASVFQFLAKRQFPRDGIVVAVGGGVVSDLAGFVAATWMRGVRWVICPTTVEAMIDAAIGGKTAINLPGGKNLVGAFHPPILVVVDPTCLQTLGERDYRAGWAESVKHALLDGEEFFSWHETHVDSIVAGEADAVRELIERNVRFKVGVVEKDPFERTGERMKLNLGHTLGHAIEECCGFSLRHGECVGLGLIAACRLSARVCGLGTGVADRVQSLLKRLHLPVRLSDAPTFEQIVDSMALDKKNLAGGLAWVLLENIGKPVIRRDVPISEVRDAFQTLLVP